MAMYFFNGLFFTAGAFTFIVIFILGVSLLLKMRKKYAEVSVWKEYLTMVKKNEDYIEAQFITDLIGNKNDDEKVALPKAYYLKKKISFIENEDNFDSFEMKVDKRIFKRLRNE